MSRGLEATREKFANSHVLCCSEVLSRESIHLSQETYVHVPALGWAALPAHVHGNAGCLRVTSLRENGPLQGATVVSADELQGYSAPAQFAQQG